MIRDAEIRRIAGAAGVEPRIVELDYALGWALRGIASHEYLFRRLVFKPVHRVVTHDFSDADELGPLEMNCYSLEEAMAEKIRAA